jgi:hypothetical protein
MVSVRIRKTEGMPVRLVSGDDDVPAAALREVDRQQRFHWSVAQLAERCNLSQPRCLALRRYLNIDDDPTMVYEFVFGAQRHKRYSDKADKLLRQSAADVDMDKIWDEYGPKRKSRRRLPAHSPSVTAVGLPRCPIAVGEPGQFVAAGNVGAAPASAWLANAGA